MVIYLFHYARARACVCGRSKQQLIHVSNTVIHISNTTKYKLRVNRKSLVWSLSLLEITTKSSPSHHRLNQTNILRNVAVNKHCATKKKKNSQQ